MRGNAVLILIWVCLVSPGPALLTAQIQPATHSSAPAQQDDLLEFVDGSLMHGGLIRMDTAAGLRWDNPAAKNPIDLTPVHIDTIRFAHAGSVTLAPTSRLRFANGDDLLGSVTSLDNDHLGFSTWFGGTLAIPRASVQSITFLSSNYTILYEGPDDDGWIVGNHNPDSWIFRDDTFISESAGSLGRDFKLSGSSTIEFDLAWSETFDLMVNIYSDAVDHLDFGNSYLIELTGKEVNLRRVDPNRQFPPHNFGNAPFPNPDGKKKVHITIQSNIEEGTVAIFVDNILAKRWKDENRFGATGGGVLFQQEQMTGAALKLSNLKVSQWEGRFEPETSAVVTNVDVIRFINRDQAAGKITGISNGKVILALGEALIQIPIQRVTQINFAATPVAAVTHGPWEVRAHFPRGGSLSFQLERWSDKEVSGRSAIFGSLAFQPGQIRQLEFNLDHANAIVPVLIDKKFEGLDE